MSIYLVRHGDDDEEYRGGWSELPLLDIGIEKCKKLAKYLKINNYEIDEIISSDLNRTQMTAEIINEEIKVQIFLEPDLREINNGDLVGMPNKKALKKFPNVFFSSLEFDETYPNGESPKEFYKRIKDVFLDIVEKSKDQNVILVTHGGVISVIWHIVKEKEWSNKFKNIKIDKTSLWKIIIDGNNMSFEFENKLSHLEK